MPRSIKGKILALISIYITFHIIIFLTQKSLIYHPSNEPYSKNIKEHGYEIVKIIDTKISLFKKPLLEDNTIVVFFHGNAGNASHRLYKAQQFADKGLGVLIVEYTGYGPNTGKVSEQTLYNDARDNMSWLLNNKNYSGDIIIYGESLGTAIAIEYLSQNTKQRIKKLILETPFDSMINIAHKHYPFILFKKQLLTERFDNLSKIKKIKLPKLYLIAKNDEVVTYSGSMSLYNTDNQPKEINIFDKAYHNTIYNYDPIPTITSFIKKTH